MEPLETENLLFLNNLSVVEEINILKKEVDSVRPLSKEQENRIMQKFRLDWNYNSNAIEGNSLDYGETAAFLMQGITAKGKPLKDYLDIKGHNEAIDYLSYIIKNKEELSEKDIRSLHEMLLVEPYETSAQTIEGIAVQKRIRIGEYKRTANHVQTVTGEIHYYASPEETPILMGELIDWYRTSIAEAKLHPVVIASVFHHRFTSIHPFDDGNGRMSRLLMNLILMQYSYPPVIIKNVTKNEYYLTLSQADAGDITPFVDFIGSNMLNSLSIYIRGARGESIDEPSDLRKKITLFKKEVEARQDRIEVRRSLESQQMTFNESILPFLNTLKIALADFKELFFEQKEVYVYLNSFPDPGWVYSEYNVSDYLGDVFSDYDQKETTNVVGFQFLNFKLAENSFSTEIKIVIQLSELNYTISYAISEANELSRIKRSLYTQWQNSVRIQKYYHQSLNQEDVNKLVSRIGEEFFEYNRALFDRPKLLNPYISPLEVKDVWIDFINTYKGINQTLINLSKDSVDIKISSKELVVNLLFPENVYKGFTVRNRIDIEGDFFNALNKKIKSAKRIFVQVSTK